MREMRQIDQEECKLYKNLSTGFAEVTTLCSCSADVLTILYPQEIVASKPFNVLILDSIGRDNTDMQYNVNTKKQCESTEQMSTNCHSFLLS